MTLNKYKKFKCSKLALFLFQNRSQRYQSKNSITNPSKSAPLNQTIRTIIVEMLDCSNRLHQDSVQSRLRLKCCMASAGPFLIERSDRIKTDQSSGDSVRYKGGSSGCIFYGIFIFLYWTIRRYFYIYYTTTIFTQILLG